MSRYEMNAILREYFLWRSKFLKPTATLDFREEVRGIKKILAYLPVMERPRAEFIAQKMREHFPNSSTEFLLHPDFSADTSAILGYPAEQIQKNDIGFFKTLRKGVIDKIREKKFDLILDFNFALDLTMAMAFRSCEAPVTVGSYAHPRADRFHSILIKAPDAASYERSMFDYLAQLR